MTSSAYIFRRRLITVSMCLCVFLAFSTTLSANSATFVMGNANSSNENFNTGETGASAVPVGPYPGTLTGSSINMFFCLTGNFNSSWDTTYSNGNEYTQNPNALANVKNGAGTATADFQHQEEAAFLASLFLSQASTDQVSLAITSVGGFKTLTETASTAQGAMSLSTFVNTVQGPIQMAIWDLMNNFPTSNFGITKPAAGSTLANEMTSFEALAQKAWTTLLNPAVYSSLSPKLQSDVNTFNANALIFVPQNCTSNQSFVAAYYDQTLINDVVPEPSTMVLFGAGGLLMALGCGRKLLAKRRAR